jgi:hypothetical protein
MDEVQHTIFETDSFAEGSVFSSMVEENGRKGAKRKNPKKTIIDAVEEQDDENDEEDPDYQDADGDGLGFGRDDETTNLLDGDLDGLVDANLGDERLMGSQFRLDND